MYLTLNFVMNQQFCVGQLMKSIFTQFIIFKNDSSSTLLPMVFKNKTEAINLFLTFNTPNISKTIDKAKTVKD